MPDVDPDDIHIGRFRLPVKTVLKLVLAVGVVLIFVCGVLFVQGRAIRHNQTVETRANKASDCWDRVLVVALHDHLTPAQRERLIAEANVCASLTP